MPSIIILDKAALRTSHNKLTSETYMYNVMRKIPEKDFFETHVGSFERQAYKEIMSSRSIRVRVIGRRVPLNGSSGPSFSNGPSELYRTCDAWRTSSYKRQF